MKNITCNININTIVISVLSIQISLFMLFILKFFGVYIPFIQEILAFVYLMIVPGLCVFLVFRLYKLFKFSESLVLSVGLSTVVIIFVECFLNFLYVFFRLWRPFTVSSALLSLTICCISMLAIFYFKYQSSELLKIPLPEIEIVIASFILIVIAILGVYQLNYCRSNNLLLIFFAIVALLPFMLYRIHSKLSELSYVLLIWSLSFSLLYYGANTRPYTCLEMYMPSVSIFMGYWNPLLRAGHNMLLPNVILYPIYLIYLSKKFVYGWRLINPVIFSVIPVVLYINFKKFLNNMFKSFLSVYLFINIFSFYWIIPAQIRISMSTFYLVFVEFIILDENSIRVNKFLFYIFSFFLIFSHYGTGLIFVFIIFLVWLLYKILYKDSSSSFINFKYVITCVVLALGWYVYVAYGRKYFDLSKFFYNTIIETLSLSFLKHSSSSYTIYSIKHNYSISIDILKYLYVIMYLSTVLGLVLHFKKEKYWKKEYFLFSLSFLMIVLLTLLPTKAYNPARVLIISFTVLSPFCISGLFYVFSHFKLLKCRKRVVFLVLFFLFLFSIFNSGFVSEVVTKDYAPYPIIGKYRILDQKDNLILKLKLLKRYRPICDILMCQWSIAYVKSGSIYADFTIVQSGLRPGVQFIPEFGLYPGINKPNIKLLNSRTYIIKGSLVLFGYHNVRYDSLVLNWYPFKFIKLNLNSFLKYYCTVYSTDYTRVCYSPNTFFWNIR